VRGLCVRCFAILFFFAFDGWRTFLNLSEILEKRLEDGAFEARPVSLNLETSCTIY
jgi:hypothetical protein